jgi:histidyl-tRNA synthetase
METVQALPGTYDLLPADTARWDELRSRVAEIMARYAYGRVETPHIEQAVLFSRSVGTETDIVQKEMYSFDDRGGRHLALRPEGTAGVVRAFVEHRLDRQRPYHKFWYWGPMFRAERPQKGRYRQFWQFGVEAFGIAEASMDAEQVALAWTLAAALGLSDVTLRLSSIGDAECRPSYRERLGSFLAGVGDRLCEGCRTRARSNPLRVLDCKEEACRRLLTDVPLMIDHLCSACQAHFDEVRRHLDAWHIPYHVDGRIVRGLDYYVRTAFELDSGLLGAQSSVLGGGRYDGLVQALGGPDVPGVGWAAGIERVLLAAGASEAASEPGIGAYVAAFPETRDAALAWVQSLRERGAAIESDHQSRSLKAQMKEAARLRARWVFVLGPEEWAQGKVAVRNLATGEQEVLELEKAGALIAAS